MTSFWLAFIPIFVAIDPVGNVALFASLTQGYSADEKKRFAFQAVLTAFLVGIVFGFGGHIIFRVLGITAADFQIAGGILLLILSVREIFGASAKNPEAGVREKWAGVVPLGIPLTAGPAFITTILILHESHYHGMLLVALVANLVIALILFLSSDVITDRLGEAFSKGTAKLVAIFLAAIAVMMMRRGLETFLVR
jgi:multiple antibiotic resistance protein